MRVYQKSPDGVFFMEGMVANKRFNKTTGLRNSDEAEAYMLRYAEQLRLESVGIVVVPPAPKKIKSLNEILPLWCSANRRLSSSGHQRNVCDHVRLHLQRVATCPMNEIDPIVWSQLIDGLLASHSRHTVNGIIRTMKLLLNWALAHKEISEIPIKLKQISVKKRPRQIVHLEQYVELVHFCDKFRNPVIGGLVRFLLGTGVRLTEGLAARWEYFDERARTYIPQGAQPQNGTKGGEADHMVMPDWLYDYLLSLPRTSKLIFPNRDGKAYSVSLLKKPLHAAAKHLNLPRLYAHLLRVSMATNLVESGIDIRTVQEMLRHGSTSTTEGYIELPSSGQRRAKKVMDGPAIPMPPAKPSKTPNSLAKEA